MKEIIQNHLQSHFDYLNTKFKNKVLMVAATGSMNYGFWDKETSNVDSLAIIAPSFRDYCLIENPTKGKTKIDNDTIIYYDIRIFAKLLIYADLLSFEAIYSDYVIYNPLYINLLKAFKHNRQKIVTMNYERTLYNLKNAGFEALNAKTHLTMRDLYKARRWLHSAEAYEQNKPYEEVLAPQDNKTKVILHKMKYDNGKASEDIIINKQKELLDRLNMIGAWDKFELPPPKKIKELNQIVIAIVQESFIRELEKVKVTDADKFKDAITIREKEALKALYKKVGQKGIISIKNLSEKSHISRPVFDSLVRKLIEFNIATTTRKGNQGIEFTFLITDLFNDEEDNEKYEL